MALAMLLEKFENASDRIRNTLSSPLFAMWAIPLILAAKLLALSPADPDLFARIAMGHLALSQLAVPLTDPFAFTKTLPMWIDHEWLSGLIFYLVADLTGDLGLIALRLLLAVLATLTVIQASIRFAPLCNARFLWITLCIIHAASAWTSTIRCQAFTYLFIPLIYWAIVEYRNHKNGFFLALTPLIGVAWVNMHGGYALGCILIGLLCAAQLFEKRLTKGLIVIAAGWAIAPFFTPYGFVAFLEFLVNSLGMERPGIIEWYPLHTDMPSFIMTTILTLPLVTGIMIRRRGSDLFALGALIFSYYCAFRHTRFLPFFMITAAIFGGPYVDATLEKLRSFRPSLYLAALRSGAVTIMCLLIVGALILTSMLFSKKTYRLSFKDYPLGAIEWLRDSAQSGRLLVDFNLGSYALWRLYPRVRISVDGRYEEAYPEETVRSNALAFQPHLAIGMESLERMDPTHILLPNTLNITDPESAFGHGWMIIYRDPEAVILSRSGSGSVASPGNYDEVPGDMWVPLF